MTKKQTQSKPPVATATVKAAAVQTQASTAPAKKKTVGDKVATVRAVGVERRCRAGMCFDQEGSPVDFAELDEVRIRALVDDPHLQIDIPKEAAPAADDDKEDAA